MNHFMADATKFPRTDCSTIIVGKNVSTTGRVLLAHNEDDPNCVVQSHLVPRMQHAEGETIRFADGTAVIPRCRKPAPTTGLSCAAWLVKPLQMATLTSMA